MALRKGDRVTIGRGTGTQTHRDGRVWTGEAWGGGRPHVPDVDSRSRAGRGQKGAPVVAPDPRRELGGDPNTHLCTPRPERAACHPAPQHSRFYGTFTSPAQPKARDPAPTLVPRIVNPLAFLLFLLFSPSGSLGSRCHRDGFPCPADGALDAQRADTRVPGSVRASPAEASI